MADICKTSQKIALFILFFSFSLVSYSQNSILLKGRVVDNNGQGIAGASIQLMGTKTIVVSASDGRFQIPVPSQKSVLLITNVGYEEQQLAVGNQTQVTVSLKPTANSLDEVVVIGYGTSKRREVTGAVTSYSPKNLEEKPITRVDQAMIGQLSGVQVRQQTGLPGQGFNVVIRGTGSISSGTEPLYVIDGFPLDVVFQNSSGSYSSNPLNNLNPDDIESIQVLKDAAAAAIYGSRAANGVVMITTKKGHIGKPKISINANSGFSQIARKLDVLSPEEWIGMSTELANYKWVNSGRGRTATQTNAERRAILGLGPTAFNTNYMTDDRWSIPGHPGLTYVDWQNEVFRSAPFQNYQVSASGGTQAIKYYFSGGYINQDGVLLNSGYKNYSARANLELTASKHLKFGLNLSPTYSETNLPSAEGKDAQLMKLYNMTPIVEDTAGVETGAGKNSVYPWASSSVSPVAYLNHTIGLSKTNRVLYSMFGELQIIPGLTARSTVNYDDQNLNRKSYRSDYVAGNISNYLNTPGKSSSGSYSGSKKQTFVNENTISYNTHIATAHSISALAGYTYNFVHFENFNINSAGGFANDIITTLSGAIPSTTGVTVTGSSAESNNAMLSYYGRAIYNYKEKYMAQASLRRDGSSRFGEQSRWGTFPSASLGWRISEEPFLRNIAFLNDLKLRASWGKSGSYNISDYATQQSFSTSNYNFGGSSATTAVPGVAISSLTDPDLRWETSNTFNVGFDAVLLKNRINLITDAYRKKSTDLFLRVPVPAASGATSLLTNKGSVLNEGLEFTLNTTNIRTKDFQWTMNANISFNRNKVLELNPGSDAPINIPSAYSGNPPFLLQKGLAMYSYYLIKTTGILSPADTADAKVAKLPGETVGDAKYFDANADGKIDANDRIIAGQPNPKYIWGLNNNFRYKGFDLNIHVYGQHGGSIYSFLGRALDNPSNGRNTNLGVWNDRWTEDNPNYNAPRGKIGFKYKIPLFTTDWLYSSDFWRVQDITLGYDLKSVLKFASLSNARVYVSFANFFGQDSYKGGGNPEAQNTNVSGNKDYQLPGDYGSMPLSKTVTFGVNLSF
jgi:TonB-dependent starch-binding outer membrane protein SusC